MCIIDFPDGNGIIFIHIPKTGGSSIESYFKKKYNLVDRQIFYGFDKRIPHSLQHCTWKEYCENWDTVFRGERARDRSKYEVFTVVRNPYTRAISEFYWWVNTNKNKISNKTSTQINIEYMENHIEKMLKLDNEQISKGKEYDTHTWTQWRFLEDTPPNTRILRQETLTEQMRADERFSDFANNDNITPNKKPYNDLLTPKVISMVNSTYARDFELFGYEMLDPEKDGVKQPADMIVWTR